jgi:ATP-binding cassette, subfamily B, bacterial
MKPGIIPLTHVKKDAEATQYRPEQGLVKLLGRVFSYTRPHKKLLYPLVGQVLLRAALLPVGTWAMAAVINGPIEHQNPSGILWGALGVAGLAAFTNWMFHFRYKLALQLGEAVIHDLRAEVVRHVFQMPMVFFDTTKVGRIIGRVTSDIDSIRTGVQDVVFISAVQIGQMLVAGAMMVYYDWVLFLVVLLLAPILWSLNRTFTQRMTEAQRKASESYSRIAATLAESVSGVRVTQGFVREDVNAAYFRDLAADQAKFNMVMAKQSAVFLPLLECNTQVFTALLLLIGGWRVLSPDSTASVGNIVQFFFLSALLFDPIKNVGNQYSAALAAMVGAERVFRLLDTPPAWTDNAQSAPLPAPGPHPSSGMAVEFSDLWFGYEEDRPVLKNISFKAAPGQTVALVGHTGSGKTSLTNLLAKLYLPQRGLLLLDGTDIQRIHSDALHSQRGVVHQQSFLFEGNVLDNIRFARPDAPEEEVLRVVRDLGFGELIEALPQGLQTRVGEGGTGLSSGQRQLVSFARALLVNPRLLILDEATSAIDAPTETRIQHALQQLLRGRTSFVVAHRLSTIRQAGLILVLDQGEIVERGTHETLLSLGGAYSRLHAHFVSA